MKRVFVIDDSPSFLQLTLRQLEKAGYEVMGTTDSVEAIRLIRHHIPDIIISDILMPKLDGYSVLQKIRSIAATARIPVIFISALSHTLEIRRAMNMGADDYLIKPINYELLVQAINARSQRAALYEQQLQDTLQKIRYNFAAILPHEFRTPLNAMIGGIGFALEAIDEIDHSALTEILGDALQSAKRLHRLLEEVLLYSKVEFLLQQGEEIIAQMRTHILLDAAVLAEDVALATAERFNRVGDMQIQRVENDSREVAVDEVYLREVVGQLVDNACKYSVAGTPIVVSAEQTDTEFVVTVCDKGRGMNREHLHNIGAFIQFDREKYEQQGIGIGLALVIKIVKLFNGTIHINSVLDEGTSVVLTLPLQLLK